MADIIRRRVAGYVKTKPKRATPKGPERPKSAPPKDDTIVELSQDELSKLRNRATIIRSSPSAPRPVPKRRIAWQWWVPGALACMLATGAVWKSGVLKFVPDDDRGYRQQTQINSPALHPKSSSAYPGQDSGGYKGIPGSTRSAPTDESFLATFPGQRNPGADGAAAAAQTGQESRNRIQQSGSGCTVPTDPNPQEVQKMQECFSRLAGALK